jgi:hypothetical protein
MRGKLDVVRSQSSRVCVDPKKSGYIPMNLSNNFSPANLWRYATPTPLPP